ncbi:MAG: hypothetical protein WC718_07080 [Phycisphaerales bacterium]
MAGTLKEEIRSDSMEFVAETFRHTAALGVAKRLGCEVSELLSADELLALIMERECSQYNTLMERLKDFLDSWNAWNAFYDDLARRGKLGKLSLDESKTYIERGDAMGAARSRLVTFVNG